MTPALEYAFEKFREKYKHYSSVSDCSLWPEYKLIKILESFVPLKMQTKEYAERFLNELKDEN